jgi:hypothetical protein
VSRSLICFVSVLPAAVFTLDLHRKRQEVAHSQRNGTRWVSLTGPQSPLSPFIGLTKHRPAARNADSISSEVVRFSTGGTR